MAALDTFPPTRAAGLDRLSAFAADAGRAYETRRNFDLGEGQHESFD